ncbi:MAG: hypothetical protein M1820_003517 [Bogoriella megaspora]|nr:MAG: hypothetical protein M1820_003517 [Bogoriella megaspora]
MFSLSKLSAVLLLATPLLASASPVEKRDTYDVTINFHANSQYASEGFNLVDESLVLTSGQWITKPAEHIAGQSNSTLSFTAGIQTSPAGLLLHAVIPYKGQMTSQGNGPNVTTFLVFDLNTAQRAQASFTAVTDARTSWFYIYDAFSNDLSGLGQHTIDVYLRDL